MIQALLTALVGALLGSQPKKKRVYRKPTPEELKSILEVGEKYAEEYRKENATFLNNRYRPKGL